MQQTSWTEDVNEATGVRQHAACSRLQIAVVKLDILFKFRKVKLLNKYKTIIAIVLPILILVLIRSFGPNHFKVNSKKLAEPSFTMSNIVSVNQIETISGEKLIVNLGKENTGFDEPGIYLFHIPADSILNRNNLNMIRKHDGPVLLTSSETAISARMWMVLSQMGCEDLYIISNDTDNEILKYKFRPDTSVRPEL